MGRDGAPRPWLVVTTDEDPGPRLCRGCGGLLMPSRHWRRAGTEAEKAGMTANHPNEITSKK